MSQFILPIIAIAGLASTGVQMGLQQSQMPSAEGEKKRALEAANQQRIADAANTEKARASAVAQSTPDAIEAGGGGLNPAGFMSLAANYANAPGDIFAQNNAFAQVLGQNANLGGASGGGTLPVSGTNLPATSAGAPSATAPTPEGGGLNLSKMLENFLGTGADATMGTEFAGSYA